MTTDNSESQLPTSEEPQLPEAPEATPAGEVEAPRDEAKPEAGEVKEEVDWQEKYKELQRSSHARDEELKAARQYAQQSQNSQQLNQVLASRYAEIAQEEQNMLQSVVGDTQAQQNVRAFYHKQRQAAYGDLSRYQSDMLRGTQMKEMYAHDLSIEHGVDKSELLKAETPPAMEALAVKLKAEKIITQAAEAQRKPQDLSTPPPAGGGGGWRDLSPDDKIRRAIEEDERKSSKR